MPKVEGVNAKTLILAMGGPEHAAKALKISDDLMSRWMSGELDPPFATKVALYWQGKYGHSTAFTESHWAHSYNVFLMNEARARVDVLEKALKQANLAPPAGRLTSHREMLQAGPAPIPGYEKTKQITTAAVDQVKTETPALASSWETTAAALDALCRPR